MEPRKIGQQMPAATFKFGQAHLDWIARRAKALGMNKSAFLRWLIERDMNRAAEPEPEKAQVAA